ncbi:MAG: P-loop ATPase, Sll1717 family [Fusobacterium sp.]
MENFKIKELKLGKNEGKREAQLEEFENLFYDFDDMYYNAISKFKFLVIGRKGTGKTLLGELIKKRADNSENWICKIENYKKFNLEILKNLKSKTDMKADEYIAIWEWIILLELSKIALEEIENKSLEEYNVLQQFFIDNSFNTSLTAFKIVEITSTKEIKGKLDLKFLGTNGGTSSNLKEEKKCYLEYLESLREILIALFKNIPNKKITLIYDELDSKFKNEDEYKNSIISLIKASNEINEVFLEERLDIKVMILLREDIFNLLNDYDLNKIKEDCSIIIDWGTNTGESSPLVDMIVNKVKNSLPYFKELNKKEIISLLFTNVKRNAVQKRNGKYIHVTKDTNPFDFMLTRTFLRPRDLVTYLNKIIDKYPTANKISGSYIIEIEKMYSDYFADEIKNELKGHLNDKEIETVFSLLYRFSKKSFYYKSLEKYYVERKDIFGELDLKKCIALLFKFSALGNVRYEKNGKKFYKWAYREDNIEVNFEEQLVIHQGLRKKLNLV